MAISTHTLIWLFPVAFMLHDFEEIILFEPWLKRHAAEIEARLGPRVPAVLARQIKNILGKSTTEFALPVSLIFVFTVSAALAAAEYQAYGFFLLASGAFFLHGFMHIGQALVLRRYIPAVLTSVLIVIPYGLILFNRLIVDGVIEPATLTLYLALSVVTIVPIILIMHLTGDYFYRQIQRWL